MLLYDKAAQKTSVVTNLTLRFSTVRTSPHVKGAAQVGARDDLPCHF